MKVSIADNGNFYSAPLAAILRRGIDNGALISCGLTVGRDGFTRRMMDELIRLGVAQPISKEAYNHSGCQSRCTLRGDDKCQW